MKPSSIFDALSREQSKDPLWNTSGMCLNYRKSEKNVPSSDRSLMCIIDRLSILFFLSIEHACELHTQKSGKKYIILLMFINLSHIVYFHQWIQSICRRMYCYTTATAQTFSEEWMLKSKLLSKLTKTDTFQFHKLTMGKGIRQKSNIIHASWRTLVATNQKFGPVFFSFRMENYF